MSLNRFFNTLKLKYGVIISGISKSATLTENSDSYLPTQKAVKSYVDSAVTGKATKQVEVFDMSFETGEVGQYKFYFPNAVTINKVRTQVVKALADTDAGTITCGNATGASTGGVATHAASAAIGDAQTATPTTNNTVVADSYYYFTSAKTTAGGKVKVSVEYTITL